MKINSISDYEGYGAWKIMDLIHSTLSLLHHFNSINEIPTMEKMENKNGSVMLSDWRWILILSLRQGKLRRGCAKRSDCNLSQLKEEYTCFPPLRFMFTCLEWLNTIHIIQIYNCWFIYFLNILKGIHLLCVWLQDQVQRNEWHLHGCNRIQERRIEVGIWSLFHKANLIMF